METASDTPAAGAGAARTLLLATAVGGGSGFLLMAIAGPALGPVRYATFAAFWSAVYLITGALTGFQQEIARAASPRRHTEVPGRPVLRTVALVAAVAVGLLTLATAPLWTPRVFPGHGFDLVLPLAAGVGSYVLFSTIVGLLYGLSRWAAIAVQVSVDGVLRLLLVGVLLLVDASEQALAWGVVLPFLLTPALLWPLLRRHVVGRFLLDVTLGGLLRNIGHTVVAAAATGVMVSGLPLLLTATSHGTDPALIGAVVFGLTVTRAPVVVVVMSLQSYLVVFFRQRRARLRAALLPLLGVTLLGAAALGVLAGLVGPGLISTVFGAEYRLSPLLLGALVASAGPIGALCLTGAATLAANEHRLFTAGWVFAALGTLGVLLLPLPLEPRTVLAVLAGPVAGLLVHLVGAAALRR